MKIGHLSFLFAVLIVLFLSKSTYAEGGIRIKVLFPSDGHPEDTAVWVSAEIASDSNLKAVTARVESKEAQLKKECLYEGYCIWSGSISLEGLEKGLKTVTIEAVNQTDQTAQASRSFVYDSPPVVSTNFVNGAVITESQFPAAVTTTDDNSVPHINIKLKDTRMYQELENVNGTGRIEHTFDFSKYAGQRIMYEVKVSDGFNDASGKPMIRYSTRGELYIEPGERINPIDQVTGSIIDFNEKFLLYLHADGTLFSKNRISGQSSSVFKFESDKYILREAELTSEGAVIWIYEEGDSPKGRIYLFKGGLLTDTGISFPDRCCFEDYKLNLIQSKGKYALLAFNEPIWINTETGDTDRLTGVQAIASDNAISDDGQFMFVREYIGNSQRDIYRYVSKGKLELEVQGGDYPAFYQNFPQWDGYTLVYQLANQKLLRKVGSVVKEISPTAYFDFKLNNGWVAYFQKPPGSGIPQLYEQDPEGTVTQITYSSNNDTILADLAPDGSLAYAYQGKLHIRIPGNETPIEAGNSNALLKNVNGKWYKAMNRDLLEIKLNDADTIPPSWPSGAQLEVTDVTNSSAKLQWPQALDNAGVSQYQIYRNGLLVDTVNGSENGYQAAGLAPQTTYLSSVVALDAAGNASTGNPSQNVTTLANEPVPITAIIFTSGSEIAEVGSTIDVQIRANDAKDLYAFLLKLQYDTSRLKLTKIAYSSEFGTENGSAVFGKDNNAPAGLLKLTGAQMGAVPGKNGSIGLTTLSFTALKNGETALNLQPESAVTDSKGSQRNLAAASFYIAVGGGDFDHDGKVGLSDLFLISQKNGLKKGQPGYEEQYDLKPDGVIDSKDIQYVANKAAKG
ncbi:cohesin domain-containing protein [Paenibacillus sedimenti]|uniref:Fibronectin type-III domain-containing protein n=1 Tax=Paenibacillus sedimenti TaxID=2770274 RepID=A0A926KP30_9BACL|nr:cohesin domain-containing protein [Paenibacillus sedimenti]MBD0379763.1 hypothetical protein [Paenibacillus sedimenti]